MKYIDGRKGGFDPHAASRHGPDASTPLPLSERGPSGAIKGAQLRAVPRLQPLAADTASPPTAVRVAMLPMQSIELAIEEMRYARKELGMRAGFLRPILHGRMLHHPDYEVFWSAVEDLDWPSASTKARAEACPRSVSTARDALRSHTSPHHGDDAGPMSGSGRRVRPSPTRAYRFMESGGGWIAPWLDAGSPLRQTRAQRLGTVHAPHRALPAATAGSHRARRGDLGARDYIGPHKSGATDYRIRRLLPRRAKMTPTAGAVRGAKRQILAGGAKASTS